MIRPRTAPDPAGVGHHYDELDPFYRSLWGEHLHHGLWATGRETPAVAARALVDEVARRAGIEAGSRVCDVGCGYGAPARHMAARGAHVTGLTLSRAQHRFAAGAAGPGPPPRYLLRDWLDNGLPDRAFDVVMAIESLAHMADKPRALAEMLRVLRPGGRLVACLWLAGPTPRPWQVRLLLTPICEEGRLTGLPDAGEYRRWAADAGFGEVALEEIGARVARTWTVCAGRVARATLRPRSLRYLLDRRNTERRFALSVVRLVAAYRTGAMSYGILTARRPT